jgi:hypothetical protein
LFNQDDCLQLSKRTLLPAIAQIAKIVSFSLTTTTTNNNNNQLGEMRVRRTPYLNTDRKPLGVARKQFSCPPPASIKKPVSLFFGGCTVLSINPSNSILSEKALQAFKYAFLRNQKIGIGSLPSAEEPSKIELDKATAAYEIARDLVAWAEQICVEDDDAMPDLDGNEAEHRSCDLKKDDRFGVSCNVVDAKDPSNHPEAKDLSLDFSPELKSKFIENSTTPSLPDLKLTGPLLEPFLDNVLAPYTPCEGMDFFGSTSLDLCETQLKWDGFGKVDRVDVDISFGVEDTGKDTVPFLHDGDNCEDNLVSPLSSPGSPCSPTSPYTSLE